MTSEGKQPEPEQEPGAPEWMVTFSDCMTLLLTFFVLLLSFSSFDDKGTIRQMSSVFADRFAIFSDNQSKKDSLVSMAEMRQDVHSGSEKPTQSEDLQDKSLKMTELSDFMRRKTFLISSGQVFWGRGAVISAEGKQMLSDLALFVKELPDCIIINERSTREKSIEDIGLQRAWAVVDYLVVQQGLDKGRFSISVGGTTSRERYSDAGAAQPASPAANRVLEIVLLERNI